MDKFNFYTNKVIFFALALVSISFPLSYKFSNMGVALLVFTWLARKIVLREKIAFRGVGKEAIYGYLAFIGLFFLQVISLLYTDDVALGVKFTEYKLSFFILPIVIADIRLARRQVEKLLKFFVFSLVVVSSFLIVHSCFHYFMEGELLTYHNFSEINKIIDVHAVFYSYYIYFAMLILVYLHVSQLVQKTSILLFYAIPLLLALVFLASKNVLITTLFSVVLYVLFNGKRRVNWKGFFILGISVLIGALLIGTIPIVKERIAEIKDLSGMENVNKIVGGERLTNATQIGRFNGTSLRLALWYIGIQEVIDSERFFIGLSPGDSKEVLDRCYERYGMYPYYKGYNMHNQAVQFFVELGLMGLLSYFALLVSFLYLSVKTKNHLLFFLLLGFLFFQFTESLFERNQGIVFFVFFFLLFTKMNLYKTDENSDTGD